MRLVHPGDRRSPGGNDGEARENDCRKDELATRHFFFFLAFPAGFAFVFFAGFFAALFLADGFFPPPDPLPKALSQFSQKAGVVPVRTIGPPMKLLSLMRRQ
jgi:hypothetical protein